MVDKIGCPFKQNSCRQLHALHSSKKSISVGRFEGQPFRQHPHTSPSEHVGIKRNGGDSHPFSRRPRSCSRKGILCVKLNSLLFHFTSHCLHSCATRNSLLTTPTNWFSYREKIFSIEHTSKSFIRKELFEGEVKARNAEGKTLFKSLYIGATLVITSKRGRKRSKENIKKA
ncbi:hypothetical protein OUZ56_014996 [Daphnia magna]|uniref:Uncharacterized protein n=1 Tax=Daphnia magna TaxID=35525 RepID=A0ABR0ALG2_9CRUS|nr:hypothetical protein OUZ56_014996 [Daphnia magna]